VAKRRERRTLFSALLLVAVLGTTAGCGSNSSTTHGVSTGCFEDLLFKGVTYTRYQRVRVTEEERPTKVGEATPVCNGTDILAGQPISIWSFPARPSTEVIGQQVYPNRFVVYFAESIKRPERNRILAAIGTIA
jgi:hypothetical protein